MIGDLMRSALNAVARPSAERSAHGSYDASTHTHYHWKCECGGHSRGGWLFESDAQYAAQRHQWGQGVSHPMPMIYSTECG